MNSLQATMTAGVPKTALEPNSVSVRVNSVAMDWVTLTTWSYREFIRLQEAFKDTITHTKAQTSSKMQYTGWRATANGGGVFFGQAEQRGHSHCMAEFSGSLSDDVFCKILLDNDFIGEDGFRCTRVDLQRTLDIENWTAKDQFELMGKLKDRGLTVGWASSKDREYGELATVYIGSRRSGRFIRLYQKVVGGSVWLRFEVVFKKAGGSDSLLRRACEHSPAYSLSSAYSGAIVAVAGSSMIEDRPFKDFLVPANPQLPDVHRQDSKTHKWLIETVLPTFKRFVSQHDGAAHDVAMEFASCIRQVSLPSWEWAQDL